MRWRTLFVFALVVAGLTWAYRLQATRREGVGQVTPAQYPLFRDFVPYEVTKLRVDNLERGVQVTLERDARGAWFMTEPLAYPGETSVVEALFRTLALGTGDPIEVEDLAGVALDPPKAVLECTQTGENGVRVHRLELGAVDLDRNRIYVRVPDHPSAPEGSAAVLLATRALYSTLDRNPDDYRDTRATHLPAESVVAIRRGGSVNRPDLGGLQDLTFTAELGSEGWKRRDPPVVSLDPVALGLVARATAELRANRFVDDAPRELTLYGLDQPLFWIELDAVTGETVALEFSHRAEQGPGLGWPDSWYFRRRGFNHVWEVSSTDLELLVRPAADLFDYFLVRARREDIERVELEGQGRTLLLAKEGTRWTVSERRPAGDGSAEEVSPPIPADAGAVADVLSAVESTELVYPFDQADPGETFVPGEEALSITVVTADGQRWGGHVGALYRDAKAGLVGWHFRRFGDELSAVIEEKVGDLCFLPTEGFRSDRIQDLAQHLVRGMSLTHAGVTFSYVHPNQKAWIVEGSGFDAPRDFTNSLVTLLGLRAERWLADLDGDALLEAVDFEVHMLNGTTRNFRLGRTPEGTLVWTDGVRSAEVSRALLADHVRQRKTDVHAALLGLFVE